MKKLAILIALCLTATLSTVFIFQSFIMTRLILPHLAEKAGWQLKVKSHRLSFLSGGTLQNLTLHKTGLSIHIEDVQITWSLGIPGLIISRLAIENVDLHAEFFDNISLAQATHSTLAEQSNGVLWVLPPQEIHIKNLRVREFFTAKNPDILLSPIVKSAVLVYKETSWNTEADLKITVHVGSRHSLVNDGRLMAKINPDLTWSGQITSSITVNTPLGLFPTITLTGPLTGESLQLFTYDGPLHIQEQSLGHLFAAFSPDTPANSGLLKWDFSTTTKTLTQNFSPLAYLFTDDKTLQVIGSYGWSPDEAQLKISANIPNAEAAATPSAANSAEIAEQRKTHPASQSRDDTELFAQLHLTRSGRGPWKTPTAVFILANPNLDLIARTRDSAHPLEGIELYIDTIFHEAPPLPKFLSPQLQLQVSTPLLVTSMIQLSAQDHWIASAKGTVEQLEAGIGEFYFQERNLKAEALFEIQPLTKITPLQLRVLHPGGQLLLYDAPTQTAIINDVKIHKTVNGSPTPMLTIKQAEFHQQRDNTTHIELIGRDSPGFPSWISGGTNRQPKDWHFSATFKLPPGRQTPDISATLRLPHSNGQIEYSRTLTVQNTLSHTVTALGVDFEHVAALSEVALALLAQEIQTADAHLQIQVSDSHLPRLGRGGVSAFAKTSDNHLILENADITLDTGGISARGRIIRTTDGLHPEQFDLALKSVNLPALRDLLPPDAAPYLTGRLTLSLRYNHIPGATHPHGEGSAEWFDARIHTVPPMRELLASASERLSLDLSRFNLESGTAQFHFADGLITAEEVHISGDTGHIEAAANYRPDTDQLEADVVLHLDTALLRRARFRLGNITIGGQTIITFGRQQDDLTTLPGTLPLRGTLRGKITPDWAAWLESAGIPRPATR